MESVVGLHVIERVVLLLLIMVAGFAVLAHKLKVPYPIMLVLAGLVLSLVPHMPRIPLNPNLVFVIFLPPLLCNAAWSVSWRDFRKNLVIISLLAVGLVGFTVWGVAEFSERFITALDWKSGFLLGAVLATTDAIAATSVAKTLGLPRQIVDILEGESLVNDATGLLALEIGLGLLESGDLPTVETGVVRLIYLIVGGIGVGLLLGVIVARLERFVDNGPIELVLSLIVPYAAYLAAEEAKASGVLAVVASGLYLSRQSAEFFSPSVRLQVWNGWEAITFMLNGIVFLLIGLQMPYVLAGITDYSMVSLVEYGIIFSLMLIALRIIWVVPAVKVSNFVARLKGHKEQICGRETFVIGWTGMRGVIALAAAVSIPETINGLEFRTRNLILFLTFSVILVTLVVQGLTLPAVIRALGLAGDHGIEPEERLARRIALEDALKFLEATRSGKNEAIAHAYDDLIDRYEHRLADVSDDEDKERSATKAEVYQELVHAARGALQVERRALIRLRDEGSISDDVMRKVERELDLEESKLDLKIA